MKFIDNIARKTGNPSLLAVEAIKAKKAGEIGKASGLFYVPKVLNFDKERGILDFERLSGLVTLHEVAVKKDTKLLGLLEKAGRALAIVHDQLILPDNMKMNLPREWMEPTENNVFIHSDFTVANVCFCESYGQLVIVDWSAAPVLGSDATYGSRYFDVIWFVISIFMGTPRQYWLNWDAIGMADAFLAGHTELHADIVQRLHHDFGLLTHRYYCKSLWHHIQQRSGYRAVRHFLYQLLVYPRFACYCLRPRQI